LPVAVSDDLAYRGAFHAGKDNALRNLCQGLLAHCVIFLARYDEDAMSTTVENARYAPPALPRGTTLRCKSWMTEAPYRMLLNNLDPEVAERREALVAYGGSGKAARNPECLEAVLRTLETPGDDET